MGFIVTIVNFREPLASNSSSITVGLGVETDLFEAFAQCSCTTSSCRLSWQVCISEKVSVFWSALSNLLFHVTQCLLPSCQEWENVLCCPNLAQTEVGPVLCAWASGERFYRSFWFPPWGAVSTV